ncbi:MAG: indole-3-glycerol phosphate synthase TrpC [Balneolaceae bacterium]|nr:indole-3-glycerol phosphate synthase TrpC [Balneolaceae bacterium]
MPNILEQIVEQTSLDLEKRKKKITLRDLESFELYEKPRRKFAGSIRGRERVSVIAEIKKASPSKGLIRADFDPGRHAREYERGGASALSVLTDKPAFQGSLDYMATASKESTLPVLRKDFIIDPYQVKEARAYGADAALLIVAITEGNQLHELLHAAVEYGLDPLVECYSEEDFNRLDFSMVPVLGVNNRDLRTFEVDLHQGVELLNKSPYETVRVSESGLSSGSDLLFLHKSGIDAALIGEHFMKQEDPGEAVKNLLRTYSDRLNDEQTSAPGSTGITDKMQ